MGTVLSHWPESLGGVAEDGLCVQITSKQQQKRQAAWKSSEVEWDCENSAI